MRLWWSEEQTSEQAPAAEINWDTTEFVKTEGCNERHS
jgi:hypothetical protein